MPVRPKPHISIHRITSMFYTLNECHNYCMTCPPHTLTHPLTPSTKPISVVSNDVRFSNHHILHIYLEHAEIATHTQSLRPLIGPCLGNTINQWWWSKRLWPTTAFMHHSTPKSPEIGLASYIGDPIPHPQFTQSPRNWVSTSVSGELFRLHTDYNWIYYTHEHTS